MRRAQVTAAGAALMVALGLLATGAGGQSRVSLAPVFRGPEHDAFPGLLRLPSGELLVTFRTASQHVSRDGRLILGRSRDGGESWKFSTLYDDPVLDVRAQIGLTRLSGGRLVMPFFKHDGSREGVSGAFLTTSRDSGRSWSRPRRVDRGFPSWLAVYGRVVKRPRRELLLSAYGRDSAVLLRSTDGGRSWRRRSVIGRLSETAIMPLGGRRLLAVGRYPFLVNDLSQEGYGYLYEVHSRDGGRSWGRPRRLLPGVSPDLIRLRDGRILLCAADRLVTQSIRCHTTVRGRRWTPEATLYRARLWDFGYPATVEHPPRRMLTVFYDDALDIVRATWRLSARPRG